MPQIVETGAVILLLFMIVFQILINRNHRKAIEDLRKMYDGLVYTSNRTVTLANLAHLRLDTRPFMQPEDTDEHQS